MRVGSDLLARKEGEEKEEDGEEEEKEEEEGEGDGGEGEGTLFIGNDDVAFVVEGIVEVEWEIGNDDVTKGVVEERYWSADV